MAEKKDKRAVVMCDSSKINSYGFRIDLSGMNLERFAANPVMLYRHNSDELIGRWENVRVEDGRLIGEPVFDLEDETAKKVSGKVERGFLKGCSVGIMINEMKKSDKESVATKTELIEASLVAIPADAGAVILYDSNRKQLSVDDFKTLQATFLTNTNTNMEEKKEPVKPDAKDEEIAQLKAELAENKKQRIDAILAAAVAQGKISEAEKPHFAKLAEADLDSVKAIIDARETKQGMSLKDLQHNAASQVTPGRESWTYLEWMKKDPQGLKAMRSNNPKEFERLQNTLK